ncbi:hypothetical protein [Mesorhizobium sp.]|uniref:hypothetical protein n=1 Tax=Mesorhizobium sp. TaxID=1871066 RepID=UPI000FEA234A|nr:hypothetical protein [Mesorhizobium sp.]RWI66734.1 MAG: hypothetical protein EOR19_31470 [Mesorhizobium sp.]
MPEIDRGMFLQPKAGTRCRAASSSLPVVLVLGELHSRARVPFLLAQLAGFFCRWSGIFPALISAFSIAVALVRRRHDRGIHDLATHPQIAGLAEVLVEPGNSFSTARACVVVLASGTFVAEPEPQPENRKKQSRS